MVGQFIIAALSGAVAAFVLRGLVRFLAAWLSARKPRAIYDCARSGLAPGYMRHGRGFASKGKSASNHSGGAWYHADEGPTPPDDPKQTPDEARREHTLYGPYTNDIGRPGFLRVTFRIAGEGYDGQDQPAGVPAVVLDVIQAPFGGSKEYRLLGQRIVRAQELTRKYKKFSIVCYTTGQQVYEYRAHVPDSSFDKKRHTLKFDNVKVYLHITVWDMI